MLKVYVEIDNEIEHPDASCKLESMGGIVIIELSIKLRSDEHLYDNTIHNYVDKLGWSHLFYGDVFCTYIQREHKLVRIGGKTSPKEVSSSVTHPCEQIVNACKAFTVSRDEIDKIVRIGDITIKSDIAEESTRGNTTKNIEQTIERYTPPHLRARKNMHDNIDCAKNNMDVKNNADRLFEYIKSHPHNVPVGISEEINDAKGVRKVRNYVKNVLGMDTATSDNDVDQVIKFTRNKVSSVL